MKKVLKFVSLALCIAVFCGIFAACGQTEEPSQTAAGGEEVSDAPDDGSSYVFTVATRAAEGDLVSSTVTWFADEISARTEGRVTLDIQYNGVLCAQGTEFEALESGICDIAVASLSSNASRWPSLGWVIVPGLFSTYMEQYECLKAVEEAGYIDEELATNNVKVLWWQPAECFNFALTDKKVETLDDLKGLKIGYAGGSDIANVLSAVGAMPVGTNAADFYLNLSTGVLEGFVNPARYMYDAQFYEVVDYMPIGITCGGSNNSVYMNADKFNEMPADLQEIFLEVCDEAAQHFLDTAEELYSDEYDLLTENGCECYELDQSVIDEYNAICQELADTWVQNQHDVGNTNAAEIVDLVIETAASLR